MSKGFTINHVIIIQSLEDFENKTGDYFKKEFEYLFAEENINIPVYLMNCEDVNEFKKIISDLVCNDNLLFPWLHIECHGRKDFGIEFKNGSELSWNDLREVITPLNIKAKLNLPLSLSTCFGAEFLGQIGSENMQPAPCRLLIGPTDEVDPGDLMRVFRCFYRNLFNGYDLNEAVESVEKSEDGGSWLIEIAEKWFIHTTLDYLRTHCNDEALDRRARSIYRRLKKMKVPHVGVGAIKRGMKRKTIENFIPLIFENYFAINKMEDSRDEFSWVLEDVRKGVARLKSKRIISFS